MFWMQDKSSERDDEILTKMNDFINNPMAVDTAIAARLNDSTASDSAVAAAGPGGLNQDSWLRAMGINPAAPAPPGHFNNLDLSSLLGSLNNTRPATSTPVAGLTAIDLQRAMLGIAATPAAASTASSSASRVVLAPEQLTRDMIVNSSIMSDEGSKSRLLACMPEDGRNEVALREVMSSEPFFQAVDSLLSGLQPNVIGSNTISIADVAAADDSAAAKVGAEALRIFLATLSDASASTPMEM